MGNDASKTGSTPANTDENRHESSQEPSLASLPASLDQSTVSRLECKRYQVPIAATTTNTEELARASTGRLKDLEHHRDPIDTTINGTHTTNLSRSPQDSRQLESVLGNMSERDGAISTSTDQSHQSPEYRRDSTTSTQENPSTYEKRSPRNGKHLTVPNLYQDREQPRCPACRWTLLGKPWTSPSLPIIAVTDLNGVVRYPYDHMYYTDESDESDDSDVWD